MSRLLLAGLAALASCSVLHNPRAGPEADAWTAARARWTRVAKLYDRFETHAISTATYQAPEVRTRRAEQVAAWKAMTAAERADLLAAERAEGERWEEFLVALFTPDPRDNDLDVRQSIWRVALAVDGEPDLLPSEVRIIRPDGTLRDLYPHLHEYDVVYRIRFGRRPGPALPGRAFTLRIAGSEGRMEFAFPPR
jgi:hypothetical protein